MKTTPWELPPSATPRRKPSTGEVEADRRWPWEAGLWSRPGPLATDDYGIVSPLLMVFRTSAQAGRRAIEAVHNDALAACASLLKLCGVDFSGLIPSTDQLRKRFASSKVRRSIQRDGIKFTHKVVELDFRREHGVYLVFILGSGRKVDDHLRQPAVEILRDIVVRIRPSIVWASHISRVVRVTWAFGPLVSELTWGGAYLGDGLRGIQDVNDANALALFVQAMQGEEEAKNFYARTRNGTRQHVSAVMEAGVAMAGCVAPYPPGLARVRLKTVLGLGESVLVFDNAEGLPAEDAVAYGYPQVFDDNGVRVDQVALVKKALKKIGTCSLEDVGRDLIAGRFSTHGIRLRRGADAVYVGHKARDAAKTILKHLDFYRDSALTVSIGLDAERWTISGFEPPDGPWATEEDFERIEEWLQESSEMRRFARRTTFGSLRMKVNGIDAKLIPYKGGEKYHGGLVFRPCRIDSAHEADSAHRGLALRHTDLADAVVAAVKGAGDKAFELLDLAKSHPVDLDYELRRLQVAHSGLVTQLAGIGEQLDARDDSGNLIATGKRAEALTADYNKAAAQIDATEDQIAAAQEKIDSADAASLRSARTVAVDELLRLIASLSDPLDTDRQMLWRSSLVDLEIAARNIRVGEVRGVEWELSGMLRIGTGERQVLLPIRASRNTAREKAEVKVEEIISDLHDGIPLECSTVGGVEALQNEVGDALGLPRYGRIMLSCRDPRILSIAMRLGPNGRKPAVVAADTGEPLALVERISDLYWVSPGAQWRRRSSPNHFVCSGAAFRNNGIVPTDEVTGATGITHASLVSWLNNRGWTSRWTYIRSQRVFRVSGCTHCGSQALAFLRLYEADAWLCLSCERDRAGVPWPLSTYAFYVDSAAEWRAIGVDVPDIEDPHPPRLVFRRPRVPHPKRAPALR